MSTPFRLVSSPVIEATEILDRLHGADKESLKHALFSLQKYIRVCPPFLSKYAQMYLNLLIGA